MRRSTVQSCYWAFFLPFSFLFVCHYHPSISHDDNGHGFVSFFGEVGGDNLEGRKDRQHLLVSTLVCIHHSCSLCIRIRYFSKHPSLTLGMSD
ncbi:hypothetical protein B0T19DRAFT_29893 [Cercophora scortea]|uniref:Uncharacterized protein n=1 Tax=Cercophora scortea TaxID=314031 RepID=A0AAE0J3V6_9PEZI|nr:hypothetical protein B0T19DRAFT_29893 [Cercophora scortea]